MSFFYRAFILFIASTFVLGVVSPVPAYAGKKKWKRILGTGAVIVGGALLLNELSKQGKRRKYKRNRYSGRKSRGHSRRRVSKARQENIRIQKALIASGYLSGHADGVLGRKSRQGIRQYQQSIGHVASGRLTRKERSFLLPKKSKQGDSVVLTSTASQTRQLSLGEKLKLCDRFDPRRKGYSRPVFDRMLQQRGDCQTKTYNEHMAKVRRAHPNNNNPNLGIAGLVGAAAIVGLLTSNSSSGSGGSGKGYKITDKVMTGGQKHVDLLCDSGRTPTVYYYDYCQRWGYGMVPTCSYDTFKEVANYVCNY